MRSNPRGFEGLAAGFNTAKHYVNNRDGSYGYGHGGRRYGYWGVYSVYGYGGDSYAQADDCSYVFAYGRHGYRRILVCSTN